MVGGLWKHFCLATLVFLASLFGGNNAAFAANDVELTVSPTSQSITLDPGTTYTGSFTVVNSGTQTATFSPSTSAYYPTDSGDLTYVSTNSYTNLTNWITFPETSYTLASGESIEVSFVIDVPADAPGGGQYAAVYAEMSGSEDGLSTISRVGCLLAATVNGEVNEVGELLKQNVPSFVITGDFNASVTIANTGNVDFDVTSSLTVKNILNGRTLYDSAESGVATQSVYPEMTRTLVYDWHDLPAFGIFEVSYTVEYAGETATISKVVWAVPLWLVLVVLGVLFLIVIFGWLTYLKKSPRSA